MTNTRDLDMSGLLKLVASTPIAIVVAIFAGGCASNLDTFDAGGNASPGIPVATPVLARVTTDVVYKQVDASVPAKFCEKETLAELRFLPLGKKIYLKFDPAALAKGDFKLEFSDSGVLKTVSVNSEANTGLDSVNTLAATLLPFVATPKGTVEATQESLGVQAEQAVAAADLKKKGCLVISKTVVKVEEIEITQAK